MPDRMVTDKVPINYFIIILTWISAVLISGCSEPPTKCILGLSVTLRPRLPPAHLLALCNPHVAFSSLSTFFQFQRCRCNKTLPSLLTSTRRHQTSLMTSTRRHIPSLIDTNKKTPANVADIKKKTPANTVGINKKTHDITDWHQQWDTCHHWLTPTRRHMPSMIDTIKKTPAFTKWHQQEDTCLHWWQQEEDTCHHCWH